VVGNSAYQNIARLDNPRNDATLIADTLSSLGFTLIGGGGQLDLDKTALEKVVQNFGRQIQGADVALFYYAGHGVQVAGSNYLVPVNANPTREGRFPDDGHQSRAAPDARVRHAVEHGNPRRLPQ
jgi:uncharacterized caspase-like protein